MMPRFFALLPVLALLAVGTAGAAPASSGEPYEINVILPMTGNGAFFGAEDMQVVRVIEAMTNRTGGIRGRPVKFTVSDDQSNPQVDVQLVQGLLTKHVPIIMGPVTAASCNAVLPLVDRDGPFQYCLSNAVRPPAGSYSFSTLFSTPDMLGVGIRYFRERGWTKLAVITSTDATGQDAEHSIADSLALPENKDVQVIDREHFALGDLNITAQVARLKSAAPQALIAWSTGTAGGTLFHGLYDAGFDVPTLTSPGNLNYAWMKQYGQFMPTNIFFSAVPYFARDTITDRATSQAIATFANALTADNVKPDQIHASSWDAFVLLVDALRKLGPDASAKQLRDYVENLHGWTGSLGRYDFHAIPQRGIGENSVVVVRWDAQRQTWTGVSKMGGALP